MHFGRNEVAFFHARDFIAIRDVLTAKLVTGDQRRMMDAALRPAVPLINVQVGAADRSDFDKRRSELPN